MNGYRLSDITWQEAAKLAEVWRVVVLPIGAGTKEHGPHLPCGTDMFLAEELGRRLLEAAPILLLPTLPYAYYPAFIDWPGSVSIEAQHFIDVVKDIIRSMHRHGFKKFLLLDTGFSTHAPMRILSSDCYNELGVRVAVTNAVALLEDVERQIAEQERGGHADEIETSLMLHIRPELVHMARAVEEYRPGKPLQTSTGQPKVVMGGSMDTESGIHGNATLATAAKGEFALDAMAADILQFLEMFSKRPV